MPDPINITQIPAPRVELIDPRTGLMSREWFRFFNNVYTIVGENLGIIQIPNGGTGLSDYPTNGQLLIGNTAGQKYELNTLTAGSGIDVTNGAGTIGIANTGVLSFSGGTTGLTPATATIGAITLAGTLDVDNGGTGQTTYTNGQLLIGNTTGNTLTKATLTPGTGITISNGAGSITINGTGGTVTSVSVVSANGFAGTVATSTTTPAITLTTTITGILKGNGTAISAAVSGTDYAPATSGTSILYGNGAGGFSNVTVGTGLTFATGTLSATSSGGTVTSVSGTGTVNGITLSGTVTSAGNLTLGGTLSNVSLTSQVTGILPVANGGFVAWQSVQTSSFTAVSNNAYPVNSTSGAITVTFPASPTAGSYITIIDYAGTAGLNNIILNPNGNKIQGSTASAPITGTRQAYNFVYIDSTQGWLSYSQQYSNFQYSASYLIVAGGGGGGSDQAFATAGAGAGAGGLLSGNQLLSSNTVYSFVVGAGGAGGAAGSNAGSVGNNSTAFSLTSLGGGGGGNSPTVPNGGNGGSGGGSGGVTGGSGTSGQGNAGGRAQGTNFGANMGGGGGAGAAGSDGNGATTGGNGGIGSSSSITGSAVYYAGGGGGAGDATPGTGGSGGGGNGGTAGSQPGANGTANTGGGGGGSSGNGAGTNAGGTGGSGVVIISVPTAYYSGVVTGSPTVTTSGSNTIITFTASGSYTA